MNMDRLEFSSLVGLKSIKIEEEEKYSITKFARDINKGR